MSGFTASSSRIRVVETIDSVDETVFDTDDDMPHIVGTTYLAGVAVDFDNLTETASYVGHSCVATHSLERVNVYVPSVWYSFIVYNPSNYNWLYDTYTSGFTSYERTFTSGFIGHEWEWVYNPCGYTIPYFEYSVDAEEYSSVTNIADLPTDEDGTALDVDFVIVQATGIRTTGGKDARFDQSLPTTVPTKTFSFQGSLLLESSGEANGGSWFRRIMSVYPSGSKLKLKVQESVKSLNRGGYDSAFPHIGETRSTYSFNLKVFFGKFRQ